MMLALAIAVAADDSWSFRDFLAGEWELERHTPGQKPEHAHYSFQLVGGMLEGAYYEVDDNGKTSEMVVRVLFHDAKSGEFQLSRKPVPATPEPADSDEPPEPQPLESLKTAFEFDFRAQNGGRFHLSDSQWKGKKGGAVQFLCSDEDSFVFLHAPACVVLSESEGRSCTGPLQPSAWTASRQGASRRKPADDSKPRSLLQRYGWYVFFGILYFGYQVAKEKAAEAAAGMKVGKKER